MTGPVIVLSTVKVTEDKLPALTEYYQRVAEMVESNEPRIIAFNGFLNRAGTEMTSIQVHPDAASMEFHMQVLRDNWDEYFNENAQMLEYTSITYYGTPPATALEMDAGLDNVSVKPRHMAGFTRTGV
jgi:hypothetical protein